MRIGAASYAAVEWLFLRALALIYLVAFLSFGVQAHGLIGAQGILPLARFLPAARGFYGGSAWRRVPTVLWASPSDGAITAVWVVGAVCSVLLLAGVFERWMLIATFVLYLSVVTAGQDFLSFQWDLLLLETGFLSIFIGFSPVVVWLYRWLLFRLLFSSGIVKLLSHDAAWRNFTAMHFHYFTQPLPTPLAWYAELLPDWFQKLSTVGVFWIELIVPFLFFLPRRFRLFAAFWTILLQLLILLTGNFAFFNWLTIALCLFLFDDRALAWLRLPLRTGRTRPRWAAAIAVFVVVIGCFQMMNTLGWESPRAASGLTSTIAPFGVVNTYGLFAVMTTTRPEILVQGSNDGTNWRDYVFFCKPGPLGRRPPWVAPHQPRLDWQMWFAALSNFRANPWFVNFMVRLLQGSAPVERLFEANPFPNAPPRYVRALVFDYRFTDAAGRRQTGDWWRREPVGTYLPAISLADLR